VEIGYHFIALRVRFPPQEQTLKQQIMPEIARILEFHLSVEKFLQTCSKKELQEVHLLINSKRYQEKINGTESKNTLITHLNDSH